jgi:hypothetical protein
VVREPYQAEVPCADGAGNQAPSCDLS